MISILNIKDYEFYHIQVTHREQHKNTKHKYLLFFSSQMSTYLSRAWPAPEESPAISLKPSK